MEKKIIRYGIAATAGIAPRFIGGLRATDNGIPLAVSSRSVDKAREFADKYQLEKAYGSYDEMLKDGEIDAVYVPLVNSLHYEYALKALEAGKHVLVEKPMVLHADEARKLAETAKERNLFLTETIKAPFLPIYKDIKEIISSGIYGKIHFITARQSYVGGDYATGWNKQKEFGGGVLYGNEAYFFSMIQQLAGNIIEATGMGSWGSHDVEDQVIITARLENSVLAINTVSTDILFNNGLTVYLDKARIEIPDYWKARTAYVYVNDELVRTIEYPCKFEMQYELQHYSDCIQQGLTESPVTTLANSIRYVELTEKIYDSWK